MSQTVTQRLLADGLMSVTEGAAFVGLGRTALYAQMEKGELAYVKLGRRRLIPKQALIEMAERGLVGADSAK
jgi:excisionase family DNA binding protein